MGNVEAAVWGMWQQWCGECGKWCGECGNRSVGNVEAVVWCTCVGNVEAAVVWNVDVDECGSSGVGNVDECSSSGVMNVEAVVW